MADAHPPAIDSVSSFSCLVADAALYLLVTDGGAGAWVYRTAR